MNRREFIVGSSAAVATAAMVGIPAVQPTFIGMDLGSQESLTSWVRVRYVAGILDYEFVDGPIVLDARDMGPA